MKSTVVFRFNFYNAVYMYVYIRKVRQDVWMLKADNEYVMIWTIVWFIICKIRDLL